MNPENKILKRVVKKSISHGFTCQKATTRCAMIGVGNVIVRIMSMTKYEVRVMKRITTRSRPALTVKYAP